MSAEVNMNVMMDPAQMAVVQQQVDAYNAELKARGIAVERDLGQDKYLKLLVTQLRYQDPQNPMQNHEFAAQMAQFSSLEQMTKMNSSMDKFINSAKMGESYVMLGKEVSWYDTGTHEMSKGVVQAIVLTDNRPMLRVGNIDVDPASVTGVRIPPPQEMDSRAAWEAMRSRAYEATLRTVEEHEEVEELAVP